jgi:diguanylate cyclase (GGDEF)-like protein
MMANSKVTEPPTPAHSAVLGLYRLALDADERALYAAAADGLAEVTRSEIAYFHLVNEDQETIELGTWSATTLRRCTAVYDRHYPISRAGVWADCARERRALIHNDYQNLATKRGYPPGHVHLVRHLGVPVFEGDHIVLLVGVGNKATAYDDADQRAVQFIADHTWRLIRQNRRIHALELAARQFHDLRQRATICVWQWDPEDRTLECEGGGGVIFGPSTGSAQAFSLDVLLRYIDDRDHRILLDILRQSDPRGAFDAELRAHRGDGTAMLLHVRGTVCPRPQGHGLVVRGILQDVTERRELSRIRFEATHDALTGLANRSALLDHLESLLRSSRRNPSDAFAVHYLDLDRCKPVNDTFGHGVGDQVLKVVAARLEEHTRQTDFVARLGGDEFVIVQQPVAGQSAAEALAAKIVTSLDLPTIVEEHAVSVGVSLGIALAAPGGGTAASLLARADHALYAAKQAGRGVWRIAEGDSLAPPETD